MLAVLFKLGTDRYAIDAKNVVEILPGIELRPVPQAPPYVRGTFNFRGHITPVIDLQQLTVQKPCQHLLSTRIMAVRYESPATREARTLGVMAEGVTEARSIDDRELQKTPVTSSEAPFLGHFVVGENETAQLIRVDRLLAPAVDRLLFSYETPRY